jgi:peptidoglycan/LPS O-acetylase OafA/YrhL
MNPRAEIPDLTICRAVFAAWVFTYHVDLHARFSAYLGPCDGLVRRGYLGVDGFFLLSGLILARVHTELAVAPGGAWRFWGRRLARIYPVHLAIIIILAGIVVSGLALGVAPRDPQRFTLAALVENLLLIHGWGFSGHLAWNYPSWSVSTEWAGYLLFPALWACIGRWRPIIAGQIIVICIPVLGLVAYVSGQGLNLTFAGALWRFFPEFLMGMATARLVPVCADVMPAKALAAAGFALAIAGALLESDITTVVGLWLVLFSLTMQADAERPALFGKAALPRFLGRLSYAYYMSFGTVEMLLAQIYRHQGWDPSGSKLLYAGAMTLPTFALAVSLHVLVETPCRRAADRWLAAPSRNQPAPVSSAG